ncbi:MAG: formate dehydrogenase accessory sulfurtransferase FdhD [Rhodobacterales bacterium]|uniref:formate dehydrogenase accessory sulfurtransferase FdhD n=1 Tax=Puniceibacterium antarcticum TaxID=1206336 RepID=UPI000C187B0D|nr:formate dehydrogenase accessory sulfurtransferase FdhD [Puniceibacterium antarcticum]
MTLQTADFTHAALYPLVCEVPVALVCNAVTLGVMMASPTDLEDFARGFALTEGVIRDSAELREIEIVHHAKGFEARLWLTPAANARAASALDDRPRRLRTLRHRQSGQGRTDAARPPLLHPAPDTAGACAAPDLLRAHQPEHDRTHGCHAAGFYVPDQGPKAAAAVSSVDRQIGRAGQMSCFDATSVRRFGPENTNQPPRARVSHHVQ